MSCQPVVLVGSETTAGGTPRPASPTYPLPATMGNFQLTTVEVDLSLDTSAYADGDVLADTQAVVLSSSPPSAGMRGEVIGCTVLDKDDNAGAFDLVFLDDNVSLGTENAAPSISDTDAEKVIAIERVSSYTDLGGADVARPDFPPIPFKVAAGTLYVGAISRDTKTYTAAGLRLKLAVRFHNASV
jgi:hypothetical protein